MTEFYAADPRATVLLAILAAVWVVALIAAVALDVADSGWRQASGHTAARLRRLLIAALITSGAVLYTGPAFLHGTAWWALGALVVVVGVNGSRLRLIERNPHSFEDMDDEDAELAREDLAAIERLGVEKVAWMQMPAIVHAALTFTLLTASVIAAAAALA